VAEVNPNKRRDVNNAVTSQSGFQLSTTSTLSLSCLLLNGDSTQVFTVEIPASKNVSTFKKLIKEEKTRHLAHLDASDLILWKVRVPIDRSKAV